MRTLHIKCRNGKYSQTGKSRTPVTDDRVDWAVPWPEYKPLDFTADFVRTATWADPQDPIKLSFNRLDGQINRKSFEPDEYKVSGDTSMPLNPRGRTGVTGRGHLGKWGPNHAADPVLTRWRRNDRGERTRVGGKSVLEFVAIKRVDTGEWAIPGGMVDAGETISAALKREFGEEALDTINHPERKAIAEKVLAKGECIYRGYVDDPRNTDNSWMETQVFNYHDEHNELAFIHLTAGSDAAQVRWCELNGQIELYASHAEFVREIVRRRGAHW